MGNRANNQDGQVNRIGLAQCQRGPLPGWHAVSVTLLHGAKFPVPDGKGGVFPAHGPHFTYFQNFVPVATAGYSIYIFHIDLADANRVRAELGLPLLTPFTAADDARKQRAESASLPVRATPNTAEDLFDRQEKNADAVRM